MRPVPESSWKSIFAAIEVEAPFGEDSSTSSTQGCGLLQANGREREAQCLDQSGTFFQQNKRLTEASYAVSLLIAQPKKPHTVGETLIKPCALKMLLAFVRYVKGDSIKEEFLFCRSLERNTRAVDVMEKVSEFFDHEELNWHNLCGVCTDGAPARLGAKSGFHALVRNLSPGIMSVHCLIHWQALASNTLPSHLQDVLEQVIKIVKYVKSSALNSRLLKQLCTEMDSEHKNLLYYTKVRWLSKGNVVVRVFELREEMQSFLQMQEKHKPEASFHEKLWVFCLAYLVDIFDQLSRLNLKLQGKGTTIIEFIDTLSALLQKLENWKGKAEEGNFTMFESLSEVTLNEPLDPGVAKDVVTHLSCLREEFLQYFPEIGREGLALMRNPFLVKVSDVQDDLQDEPIEFQNDSGCRDVFEASSIPEFWSKMMGSYPNIAKECLRKLLPFATTYLCESGFSTLVQLKTKARNRLECEADLRCALSTTEPRIWKLVQKIQENIIQENWYEMPLFVIQITLTLSSSFGLISAAIAPYRLDGTIFGGGMLSENVPSTENP
uniref:zinc finger BED domain-containing protein 5-like n=1 Tax=Myxine glutinosa TaxID=7769 RepID=UPI00358E6478